MSGKPVYSNLVNGSLLVEVDDELVRAESLHGKQANLHESYAVLLEEVDEFWDEVKVNQKRRDMASIRKELIQIAAMALRTIKDCVDEPVTP